MNRPTAPGRHGSAADEFEPNLGAVRRAAAELQFQLPGGQVIVMRRDRSQARAGGDAFWGGTVLFDSGSQVTLTVRRNFLGGSIRTATDVFEIRPEGARHIVERLNLASFPPCAGGRVPQGGDQAATSTSTSVAAAGDVINDIHLLSMYTPQARDAAGGVAQIEAQIQAAVDNANAAFTNSLVNARYNLVHAALANRNDSGDMSLDLSWLRADSATAALRNQYGADMVSLFVANGGSSCGIGYVMRSPGPSFESYAFQVTDRDCAVGNLTFAHEHGHNLGMEHDPANGTSPSSASYPWSFGHYVNGVFRTVMSYATPCSSGCTRVAYFSNPLVAYLGNATGIVDQRDNARTANLTTPIAAAFRSAAAGSPPAAPSGLSSAAVSASQIDLTWTDNSGDETGFKLERSTDGVNFTQIASLGASVVSYSNTGLSGSTTYTYRIRATNSAGDSGYSNTTSATTPAAPPPPPSAPAAPSSLTASAVYSGTGKNKILDRVNLSWVDVSDETQFELQRCKVSGKGQNQTCTFAGLAVVGQNVTTYADLAASLSGSGTYRYRVRSLRDSLVSGWTQTQVQIQ